MKWNDLTGIQQNALIAEKVEDWQWVPFDFDDVYPMKGQLWLLPDALSTHDLSPGEWTWYLEEEQVYPEGKLFPFPHKDKRIVPTWLPSYTTNICDAWQIVESLKFAGVLVERLYKTSDERKYVCKVTPRTDDQYDSIAMRRQASSFGKTVQEAICKAALLTMGVDFDE